MAVAVSILVARVTACVKVGPPKAELATYTWVENEAKYLFIFLNELSNEKNTHLISLLTSKRL